MRKQLSLISKEKNRTILDLIEDEIKYLLNSNLKGYKKRKGIRKVKRNKSDMYHIYMDIELGERIRDLKKRKKINTMSEFFEFVLICIIKNFYEERGLKVKDPNIEKKRREEGREIMENTKEKTVGVKKAAEMAGFRSRSRVNQLCIDGVVPGAYKHPSSGYWRIPLSSALNLKRIYKEWEWGKNKGGSIKDGE
jgi:hypothetical protein